MHYKHHCNVQIFVYIDTIYLASYFTLKPIVNSALLVNSALRVLIDQIKFNL